MLHKHSLRLRRALGVALVAAAWMATPPHAAAQVEVTHAEEPTQGLRLPAVPLAGEHDAFSVATNPAGLHFLRGFHLGVGIDMARDRASSPGQGAGLFLASSVGGGFLPAIGLGLGVEMLRPSRVSLSPDPGTPTRLSLAMGVPLARSVALGLAWRRFFDDPGLATRGLSGFDLGFSARLGTHVAVGAVLRDLNAPAPLGVPVQRRYELEIVTRPLATDRLELAFGGRVGETDGDIDGWARVSTRLVRGVYLEAELASRAVTLLETSPAGSSETSEREALLTAGLEVSLGAVGAGFFGTGVRGPDNDDAVHGGSVLLRASSEHVPSFLGSAKRIERIELSGEIDDRKLAALVLRLRAVARDPGVTAVLVPLEDIDAGWATIEELRQEIGRVRQAGKKVFAFLVTGSTRSYYLATAASKIYMDPAGGLRLTGMSGSTVYYKGLFDRLGVTAEFEKIDEYKSAPEAWTHQGPTEPAARVRTEIYDQLFATVVSRMAASRGVSAARMRSLIDQGPFTAGDLRGLRELVDAVVSPDDVGTLVARELGRLYPVAEAPRERPERWSTPSIAIIYIDGDIVDGKSQSVPVLGMELVGGETIVAAISAARSDPSIEAIVLRIDSPGGSALASEQMAREVFKTRGIKPIICSFGDIAASGGYFAAAGCDVIFAEPTTITGSIGIFYGKFDLSGLMSRLGLTWTTYRRGARADMDSYLRPYTAEERALIRDKMRYLYQRFTGAVSEGRGLTRDEVDNVGRGRVWTGAQAMSHRLVDRMGGLADAIALAKARAGLGQTERVQVVELPAAQTGVLDLILGAAGAAREQPTALDLLLPGGGALLELLPGSLWIQPDVPQARLPYTIVWH